MSFRSDQNNSFSKDRNEYRVFISHSWDYADEYERMVDLLNDAKYFNYKNYSVPQEEELDAATVKELKRKLREKQIKPASVVIVLAGLYSTHSKWIGREIRIANDEGKPILGVEPWGSERTSNYVKKHADEVAGWNTKSIVDSIRNLSP
jgi:hypothetical protein